jgi:hypothetical protein
MELKNTETPTDLSMSHVKSKGTGAGGSNTNNYGKKFEEKTNNEYRLLLEQGFKKNELTKDLTKKNDDLECTFTTQGGLKKLMKREYDVDIFRCPDEAYVIEFSSDRKVVIHILEKKEQRVAGSVETKLWSGPSLKKEYELVLGDRFEVQYGFCVSSFLKEKILNNEPKYAILRKILKDAGIVCLFGDDDDYFETLDSWLNNSL